MWSCDTLKSYFITICNSLTDGPIKKLYDMFKVNVDELNAFFELLAYDESLM